MDTWFPTFRSLTVTRPGGRWSWWPFYTTAAQRLGLLRLIAIAIEENLPLLPLLESWAQDESGVQHRRLQQLIRLLQAGRALPDALEEVPHILREEDLLAVRFDAQMGTRTAAVRQLLSEPLEATGQPALRLRRALIYFCTVVPCGLVVIAFTQVFIIPKIQRLFVEFGIEPSPYMSWPAWLLAPFTLFGWLGLVVVLLVMIALFATRSGRALRRAVLGRCFRSLQELRAADVLQKLSVAVSAGRPIAGALSTMARYHFDPATRQQLLFVRNEMEQGAEVWDSMLAVKMLTPPEAHLLRTSESSGNRSWILNQLVGVKRRQTWSRLDRSTVFALPAVVVLLALIVFLQTLSLFDPLVRFIEGLL